MMLYQLCLNGGPITTANLGYAPTNCDISDAYDELLQDGNMRRHYLMYGMNLSVAVQLEINKRFNLLAQANISYRMPTEYSKTFDDPYSVYPQTRRGFNTLNLSNLDLILAYKF